MQHPKRDGALGPPASSASVLGWLQANLFSSTLNTILTLLACYVLYVVVPPILDWTLLSANWGGNSAEDCTRAGACWVFIKVRFQQFMFGFYPESERWRVMLALLLLIASMMPLFFRAFRYKGWLSTFLLFGYPVIAYYLLLGDAFGLPMVETSLWGGLLLTLVLSTVGIVAALPLGILLALGRRSHMPLMRAVSVAFIELWRGVPLITVLFMASVMLPLFLPEGTHFDKLLRAMVGIVLFESAYMAEVVRGGLQAVPKGQYEAAEALGLNYWKTMGLIVLPQALKLVIPGIVNTFIALFKDTTLVLIIGLMDLLAIIQAAFADPEWLEFAKEGYVFAALVFWVFCFGMSRYSQVLERKLSTGRNH